MSSWAEIPGHLLDLIAEKGTGFEDIVVVGLICRRWRDEAADCRETFVKKQAQQLPWLMLPPTRGKSRLRGFYSLATRRTHRVPSREFNGKKCFSSRGWLLTVGPDWGMDLLHPMTLARFKLPGIESFDESSYAGLVKPQVQFICRAVLSASPSLTSNFVLLVMYSCPIRAAYWRPGDKRWTVIEILRDNYADAVFYQDKCYFITFNGKLLVTEFGRSNPTTTKFVTEFSEDLITGDLFEALYLVILEGYLLLVSREGPQCLREEKEFQERPYETINFQVFKLDFKSLDWEELESLGNWSLFLGHNSSTALNASVVKGCKPNSIYFTDDNLDHGPFTKKGAGFDMGIFNMADRTIEPLIEEEWRNRVSAPIFVDPTF